MHVTVREQRGCVRAGDAYNPPMELAAEVRVFIERQRGAHLATAGADGTAQLVPIYFALLDGVVYSTVDDKPKRAVRLRRVQNIAERAAVAVLFDHYEEDWGAWAGCSCADARARSSGARSTSGRCGRATRSIAHWAPRSGW